MLETPHHFYQVERAHAIFAIFAAPVNDEFAFTAL